ncbi:MAG: hypothetical protein DRQ55_13325 [Planctomycetota bacterium]|nr:MAG: hypothetical protein DRQ55_13325 [Planctomycetota bacterium]
MARLTGLVLRASDDSPVADVAVSVRLDGEPSAGSEETRTSTDSEGRFSLSFERAVQLRAIFVGAGESTGGLVSWRRLTIARGAESELTLHVSAGASLRGRVQDEAGLAMAGARVQLWSRPAYLLPRGSDAGPPDRELVAASDGSFELPAAGPQFVLSATRPGFVCVERVGGELVEGAHADNLRLVLAPAAELRGRVTGADGRPLPGVSVEVRPERPSPSESLTSVSGVYRLGPTRLEASSDGAGAFLFPQAAARTLPLHASLSGYLPKELEHDPRDGELLIELGRGASLAGLVLGADGRPLPDAEVRVRGAGSQTVTTAADGRFLAKGLEPSSDGRLHVLASGHALQVLQPVQVSADEQRFVQVQLEPGRALAGRVLDADGQPLAGARVRIEGDREVDHGNMTIFPRPTWERSLGRTDATADAQGRFRISELYAGEFKLSVTHPNASDVTRSWQLPSGSEDLELVLEPGALSGVVLVGTVRDAHTGQPVTAFQLTPMRPMGNGGMAGSNRSFDDLEGRFVWPGLEPGEFQLNASAEGYGPWSRPLQPYDEGEHILEITLRAQRDLHLRCVDEGGVPIFGATPAERQRVLPLLQSGELAPLQAQVVLSYHAASGEVGLPVSFGPDGAGGWGLLSGDALAPSGPPGSVSLPISEDGGSLLIRAGGYPQRLVEVPPGADDLAGFVVLLRE